MPYWLWTLAMLVGVAAYLAPWAFLFWALVRWMEADRALQAERHQYRLTRIRAGLSPDGP